MKQKCLVIFAAFLALGAATSVEQCRGRSFQDLSSNVELSCKKIPCRLKRGTVQNITILFEPETDIKDLKNRVTAEVIGVPFPFIGVDGQSVCSKIETESGEKAGCPLKAGTKYRYRDSFPVYEVYPKIDTRVHWALQHGGKDLICFELPAKITS